MAEKSLKSMLAAGEPCIGGWVMIGHPASAEIMARAGFAWVAVDMEHTAIDMSMTENLIRTIEGAGSNALVRLTNNDENLIKRVMDSGATGIIVPMVHNAKDAQRAVDAMYYPPRGKRGVGLARAQRYGAGFRLYQERMENELVCTVQIEHIDAVENCREIFAVDGIDAYMLGPYDLSASMGLAGQIDHPDVVEATHKVRSIAKEMDMPGGMHIVEPEVESLKAAISKGFTFIAYSIDTRMLDVACRSALRQIEDL